MVVVVEVVVVEVVVVVETTVSSGADKVEGGEVGFVASTAAPALQPAATSAITIMKRDTASSVPIRPSISKRPGGGRPPQEPPSYRQNSFPCGSTITSQAGKSPSWCSPSRRPPSFSTLSA